MTTTCTGVIAYQGEPGANSDAACREKYPAMTPLPCPTFEDAFEAVTSGSADLAMIPVENNIAGRVADIHRLLPDSGLYIVDEHFLPIHFHLAAASFVRTSPASTADPQESSRECHAGTLRDEPRGCPRDRLEAASGGVATDAPVA